MIWLIKMTDEYVIQQKIAPYRQNGGYWQDIQTEVRILKNGEVILHLEKLKIEHPVKHIKKEELR